MTSTTAVSPATTLTPLIGHYVPEILSLARRGLLWAVVYGVFTRGSQGGCLAPDELAAPVCYNATLNPSPVTWFLMALVFVVALGNAAKATSTAQIGRVLRIAATAMWALPLLAAVLALTSFFGASPETWLNGVPPANVTLEITSE